MNLLNKISKIFILSGITLAILFAAGNLTIPPLIGFEAKENTPMAILGFILTGAGLPALGIAAFSTIWGDFNLLTKKVSKNFGNIYMSIVYLITIFFSIPRTAIISNDMFLIPVIKEISSLNIKSIAIASFIFYILYFLFVYITSINPSKSIDITGKLIIPILFVIIFIIILGAIVYPQTHCTGPIGSYKNFPLIKGLIMGFLTIDALTSHIICQTLIDQINEAEKETKDHSLIIKDILYSSIITFIILCLIYSGLSYIGATTSLDESLTNGGPVLIKSAFNSFGRIGSFLLSISVLIACFTTAFTVLLSAAKHFHGIFSSISYKIFLIIECIICTFISNLNFNIVLKLISPILDIMYPIIIIIIMAIIFKKYLNYLTLKISILVCTLVNIIYIFYKYMNCNIYIFKKLPLFDEGIGWIIPTLIISIIVHLITFKKYESINLIIKKDIES